MQTRHGGTTLLEAVIALALLAGLLVAASGLLLRGSRQILSGANASRGLAIARTVLEQVELRSHAWLVGQLCDDALAASCAMDSSQPSVAAWKELARNALPGSDIDVRIEAVDGATVASSSVLRVTVRLEWKQGRRVRRLRLSTLRV